MPVRDRRGKLPKAERAGLGRAARLKLEGRCRYRRANDVKHIAGPTTANDILQDQQRKGTIAGPTKARMRLGGIKDCNGRGREGGYKRRSQLEVSVGLVRRQETPQRAERGESQRPKGRTGIWGISKAVVGRAAGQDCRAGARRRHTEVRSSYHFRVRTEMYGPSRRR
ncbi:hypothetical protein BY996DRAFT_6553549 [Phakopsora pachyrhizi]|nr:hypothetical protein BY996DRAFT_6553549 [Phakopsora pachyrhizi]